MEQQASGTAETSPAKPDQAESKKEKDECKLFCAGPKPEVLACQVRTVLPDRPIGRLVGNKPKGRRRPEARRIFGNGKLKK